MSRTVINGTTKRTTIVLTEQLVNEAYRQEVNMSKVCRKALTKELYGDDKL